MVKDSAGVVPPCSLFKKRLDKFWADQNVMFDWTADITGTGDRSEYIVESDIDSRKVIQNTFGNISNLNLVGI